MKKKVLLLSIVALILFIAVDYKADAIYQVKCEGQTDSCVGQNMKWYIYSCLGDNCKGWWPLTNTCAQCEPDHG